MGDSAGRAIDYAHTLRDLSDVHFPDAAKIVLVRRVTTDAYPMNRLVALVMLLTLAFICAEIVWGEYAWWIGWGLLALAGSGFVPYHDAHRPQCTPAGSRRRIRRKSHRDWRARSVAITC
jgi:hypothetical protein